MRVFVKLKLLAILIVGLQKAFIEEVTINFAFISQKKEIGASSQD